MEGLKELQQIQTEQMLLENPKSPTLLDTFKNLLENRRDRNLESDTILTYESYIGKFENYLFENKLADIRLDNIDTKFIKDCLKWMEIAHEWNNTTYNNHLNFWVTLLNWFAKKPRFWLKRDDFDIGNDGELERKVEKVMKNQYYVDSVALKVKEKMKYFPKLLFFSKFIYFSCIN